MNTPNLTPERDLQGRSARPMKVKWINVYVSLAPHLLSPAKFLVLIWNNSLYTCSCLLIPAHLCWPLISLCMTSASLRFRSLLALLPTPFPVWQPFHLCLIPDSGTTLSLFNMIHLNLGFRWCAVKANCRIAEDPVSQGDFLCLHLKFRMASYR